MNEKCWKRTKGGIAREGFDGFIDQKAGWIRDPNI